MSDIFLKIVNGELPSYKVAENEKFLAFLDIFPIAKGHTLVIPKIKTDYIFDMNSDDYMQFWEFSKKIAEAMKKVIECQRIGIAVVGLEVPHAHIHLVPLNTISDINFEKPKLNFSNEKMEQIATLIRGQV
tara:strand:- start:120 stop:512 length:393 start_codon:yes stop_codon:yes gene_type:complete